jgi:coproporphyrinogen III oxidase-like Fe-S oxidoreductase
MIQTTFKRVAFRLFAGQSSPPPLSNCTLPSHIGLSEVGLYLHVPFCNSLCPFCPYNRVRYDADSYELYEQGVYRELARYSQLLKGCQISSLYIGGGTPTVDPEGLLRMIARIKDAFPGKYSVAVELHPAGASRSVLASLRLAGVTQVSVGAQSLVDNELRGIGRNHSGDGARRALEQSLNAGMMVNADLMFALAEQDDASWQRTVAETLDIGVHEISTYPMFSFPYAQPYAKLGTVPRRSPERVLRRRLEIARSMAAKRGFQRSTVWSWTKADAPQFSSVTRHRYIGLGPGAASMTGSSFYVNTFSVSEYARVVQSRQPIALCMSVSPRLERAYWLYWSLYALQVSRTAFATRFHGCNLDREFGRFLRPMRILGWLREDTEGYRVTDSGAYWIHRAQNAYSLNYLERLWGACMREAWPTEVHL